MVPILGPLMADPARRFVRGLREEHARNHSRALRAAQTLSGLSREDLTERILQNPSLIPIVARVLFASAMTGQDEILDALGAALGSVVLQPDRVDDVELVLIGLQDIRRHHVAALRVLDGPPEWREEGEEGGDNPGVQAAKITTDVERLTWNVEAVAGRTGMPVDTTYVTVTGLANAGFVRALGAMGGLGYRITDLGRTLLEVLERYNDAQAT